MSIIVIIISLSILTVFIGNYILVIPFLFSRTDFINLMWLVNNLVWLFLIGIFSVSLIVFIWARFYINERRRLTLFYFVLFFFVLSIILLIFSRRLMSIFLGWEGLGITSFVLIVFYQNWSRWKGGLLTLLTNRIGDAILLVRFSYWLLVPIVLVTRNVRLLLILFFTLLRLTKSAQTPFTRWLPAAIAAPTPVRALVHSSTLVTAGVWLIVRFGQVFILNSFLWGILGLATLLVASCAALKEIDAKKIVALSTLRQLGLIYLALMLSGPFIVLFHLLIHALAKANLFLRVGTFIHSRFSQQDVRRISLGREYISMFLFVFIRIISLSGLVFTSGFFSKDLILLLNYFSINRLLFSFLVVGVITLTLSYCVKLLVLFLKNRRSFKVFRARDRISIYLPRIIFSSLRITLGYFFVKNLVLFKISNSSINRFMWIFLLLFPLVFYLFKRDKLVSFFKTQLNFIDSINNLMLRKIKNFLLSLIGDIIERFYSSSSLNSVTFSILNIRLFIVLILRLILIWVV